MNFRTVPRSLLLVLAFAVLAGCARSDSSLPPAPANSSALSPDAIIRVHWLGKREMQLHLGSFYVMRLWQLPASANLQTRTLSKLAAAPARWLAVPPERAQLANDLLARSLNDVVLDECYLEIRQPANQAAEFVFSTHPGAERAGNWETNLANIVGLLTGEWPQPLTNGIHGWTLHRSQSPDWFQFQRTNDWAVFGVGTGVNPLFNEITGRIRSYRDPFAAKSSTNWLEADVKLSRLPAPLARAWHLSGNSPDVSLTVAGDGANVLTRAQLTFPEPLQLEIEPWTVPADLIPAPLDSFTAVRGLRPWLSSLSISE